MNTKIYDILEKLGIDAYVGYDFRGSNYTLRNILHYHTPTTRRWVAIITKDRKLHLVIPKLEVSLHDTNKADEKHVYTTYQEYNDIIKGLLKDCKTVAADISENNDIPVLDVIPSGFLQLINSAHSNINVVSSGDIAQYIAATWTQEQYQTHKRAADGLKKSADAAWEFVTQQLKDGKHLTDLEVENFILAEYKKYNLVTQDDLCIVSINERASNPHYWPTKEDHQVINPNSSLLFDIWAKEDTENSIYADCTFMAWVGPEKVPAKVQEVWEVVRDARDAGVNFVKDNAKHGIKGFQVDRVTRDYIINKGYSEYFVHRTGHSIDTNDHGSGTNMDDFETKDTRDVIPTTGFSVEPGIYLPEFGVRSELNMFIHEDGTPEVTTWQQMELVEIKL